MKPCVAKGKDAAVGCDQPITVPSWSGGHTHDRLVQWLPTHISEMRRLAKIHYAADLCRYPVPRTIMFGSHCSNGRSQRLAVWLPIPDSSPYNFDLGCCRWGRKQSQRCQESCYGTDEPHLQHGGQVCLFISWM